LCISLLRSPWRVIPVPVHTSASQALTSYQLPADRVVKEEKEVDEKEADAAAIQLLGLHVSQRLHA
jgi:hypothetical protein